MNTREVFCTYDFDRYNHNVYQVLYLDKGNKYGKSSPCRLPMPFSPNCALCFACGLISLFACNQQIVFSLTSFFAPLVVIFVLYMLMLNRLWLRARSSAESVRSRRRVTRLVVVVVLTFAVCWAPIQVCV